MPIYGGTLIRGYWVPRSFDGHQKTAYGPTATLPVFNQLVMFSLDYKETVPETIIGDLGYDAIVLTKESQKETWNITGMPARFST